MSAEISAFGVVVEAPKLTKTANDVAKVTARIKVEYSGKTFLVSIIAYAERAYCLLAKSIGDNVYVRGTGYPTWWDKGGAINAGISLQAQEIR